MNDWKKWLVGLLTALGLSVTGYSMDKLWSHEVQIARLEAHYEAIQKSLDRIERHFDIPR